MKVGTATITAESSNGKVGTCTVTVTQNGTGNGTPGDGTSGESVTVSSVKLAVANRPYGIKTVYLKKKAKLNLAATVMTDGTNKAVTYTSSNKNISVNSKDR